MPGMATVLSGVVLQLGGMLHIRLVANIKRGEDAATVQNRGNKASRDFRLSATKSKHT
jgi:hypothetical protein